VTTPRRNSRHPCANPSRALRQRLSNQMLFHLGQNVQNQSVCCHQRLHRNRISCPGSYYCSYKKDTSHVNRCASQSCHIPISRKKLQEKLLPLISTEFSSLAAHNTSPWELSKTSRLAHHVCIIMRYYELHHHLWNVDIHN
jgi:hypothetical protein